MVRHYYVQLLDCFNVVSSNTFVSFHDSTTITNLRRFSLQTRKKNREPEPLEYYSISPHHHINMQLLPTELHATRTSIHLDRLRSSCCPAVESGTIITSDELLRRKHFCIFLLILTNHLDKTDQLMRRKVKALVRACTRKHREGDHLFTNLTEVLKVVLQSLVGDKTWQHCQAKAECFINSIEKPV